MISLSVLKRFTSDRMLKFEARGRRNIKSYISTLSLQLEDVWFWLVTRSRTHICGAAPAARGGLGKGWGWRAVPGGLVCRVGDGCEQGHLHGRQSACHFCSGTCCHQGDRRQRGQDSTADSLSEAAVIKPTTSHAKSPTTHTKEVRISIPVYLWFPNTCIYL